MIFIGLFVAVKVQAFLHIVGISSRHMQEVRKSHLRA